MANKNFLNPFILALHYEDESEYTGGASAHGNLDPDVPIPMTWEDFQNYWYAEFEFMPELSDYKAWWVEMGFTVDDWNEVNPGIPWDDSGN